MGQFSIKFERNIEVGKANYYYTDTIQLPHSNYTLISTSLMYTDCNTMGYVWVNEKMWSWKGWSWKVLTWIVSVKFKGDNWSWKTQLERTRNWEVLGGKAQNEIGKNKVGKQEPKLESNTEVWQRLLLLENFPLSRKQPLKRL